MKKLLLLSFAVSLCIGASAQNKPTATKAKLVATPERLKNAKPVKIEAVDQSLIPYKKPGALNLVPHVPSAKFSTPTTEVIGKTFYDLQTNATISNRLVRNSDGTLSAAWTTAAIADPGQGYSDRGTGYNYHDGTSWTNTVIPSPRIETYRCGFANIAVTASGKEVAISHSSAIGEVNVTTRPTKGTGAWTDYDSLMGFDNPDTWVKCVAGGASGENIYAIVNGAGVGTGTAPPAAVAGQQGPLFYARSTDGGATFPTFHQVIAGTDSTFYRGFGGDDYSIDARGDVVAIALGDYNTDLMLLKSTDGGVTFTKTIISASPITQPYDPWTTAFPDLNLDGFSDTLELPSGDAHVMIDNNGSCHVFFTTVWAVNDDGMGTGFFPNFLDGLYYWNETSGAPVVIANTPDINGNGQIDFPSNPQVLTEGNGAGSYRGSLLEKPSSGVDAAGNLYASFMGGCEDCDSTTFGMLHKHTFVISSSDNGATWSQPYDVLKQSLAGGPGWEYSETVFGCIARDVDGFVHMTFQQDDGPGTALSGNDTVALQWNQSGSDIVYAKIPTADLLGVSAPDKKSFSLISAPNPASEFTNISLTMEKPADVTIEISNTLGQVVYTQSTKNLGAGTNNFRLNTSSYPSGIYLYSVTVGNEKMSKKLVVN